MIKVKATRKSRGVQLSIPKEHEKHERAIVAALHTSGQIVCGRTQELITTGTRTGRLYRINGREHRASAPGEPPASITGTLADSCNYNVHGVHSMEVGESAEYAAYLEDGTERMEPRPHMSRAVDETQGDIVTTFEEEFAKEARRK